MTKQNFNLEIAMWEAKTGMKMSPKGRKNYIKWRRFQEETKKALVRRSKKT